MLPDTTRNIRIKDIVPSEVLRQREMCCDHRRFKQFFLVTIYKGINNLT